MLRESEVQAKYINRTLSHPWFRIMAELESHFLFTLVLELQIATTHISKSLCKFNAGVTWGRLLSSKELVDYCKSGIHSKNKL